MGPQSETRSASPSSASVSCRRVRAAGKRPPASPSTPRSVSLPAAAASAAPAAGYRNWSEVASALAGRPKREAKAREALERERQATLRLSIKAPTPAGGKPPSRRMVRVAANCHRILCDVLAKRAVKDAALYPAGQVSGLPRRAAPRACGGRGRGWLRRLRLSLARPMTRGPHALPLLLLPPAYHLPQAIDITEVTMTPDLRRAYVLWALPFPVTCRARATDPAGLALEQRREREEARALRETAAAAAAEGPGYADVSRGRGGRRGALQAAASPSPLLRAP